MDKLNKLFLEKAKDLAKDSDVVGLENLISKERIQSIQFINLLKNLQKDSSLLNKEIFWKSNLPFLHLNEVLGSGYSMTFLELYFNYDRNSNHKLNSEIYKLDPAIFLKSFKLFLAFNKSNFYESLEKMLTKHYELGSFLGEIDYIKSVSKDIEEVEKKIYSVIDTIPVREFLVGFHSFNLLVARTLYGDDLKTRSDLEASMLDILERYLLRFCKKEVRIGEADLNSNFNYIDEINKIDNAIKAKKAIHPYHTIFGLLKESLKILRLRNIVESYLTDQLEFEDVMHKKGILRSNKEYYRYRINDVKKPYAECYLYYKSGPFEPLVDQGIKSKTLYAKEFFKFYGLEDYVDNSDLLKNLTQVSILLNQSSLDEFNIFNVNRHIDRIVSHTEWNRKSVESFLDLITFDFENPPRKFSKFLHFPFIKIKDNYIWLGSFLKERDWTIALYNKIKSGEYPGIKKHIADDNLEYAVCNIFKKTGFKSKKITYGSSKIKSGDIDVVAQKGNDIYLVEVKSGIFNNSFSYTNYIENMRLEYGASNQLIKSLNYITENWEEFKGKFGLDNELNIDDINLIPLIVTNYYDGDLMPYSNGIRKASMIELDVILNNTKEKLFNMRYKINNEVIDIPYDIILRGSFDYRDIINYNSKVNDYDLWESNKKCDYKTFINIVDNNKVWSDISDQWNFEPIEFRI